MPMRGRRGLDITKLADSDRIEVRYVGDDAPGCLAQTLASETNENTLAFEKRVRQLKDLGLTGSLEPAIGPRRAGLGMLAG